MKKFVPVGLITLSLFVQACDVLPIFPTKLTGDHLSGLTLYGTDIYFGAGYCLYRLNIQDQTLDEIICTQDWTFQRPAVDGERIYAQVLISPKIEQFFAAIDLSTGTTSWRVKEPRGYGRFRTIKEHTFLVNGQVVTARRTGIDVFDAQSGHRVWHSGHNWMDAFIPFLIHDDLLWYPIATSGETSEDGVLVAVEPSTGDIQQTINLLPDADFDQLLYVDDKWIFGWDSQRHPLPDRILAVNRARPGEVAWFRDLTLPAQVLQPVLYGDLFIFEGRETVYALDIDSGQVAWTFNPNTEYTFTESFEQIAFFTLVQGRFENERLVLYALDAASGTVIWEYTLGHRYRTRKRWHSVRCQSALSRCLGSRHRRVVVASGRQ